MFGFRNPGLMRVPIEQAVRGGDSDCRNRLIQKMFQFVGAGDQAGSGVPRIFGVWKTQSWRSPVVHEKREPEQTLFELRMASLLPDDVVGQLESAHGDGFRDLAAMEKLILVTAAMEGHVDHKRVRELTDEHPADVSKTLGKLARDGFLIQSGHGRGTVYIDPAIASESSDLDLDGPFIGRPVGSDSVIPQRVDSPSARGQSDDAGAQRSGPLDDSSGPLSERSGPLRRARELISDRYPAGIPGKLGNDAIRSLIIAVCAQDSLTLRELSAALDRAPDFLRKRHLRPLIEGGALQPEFADRLNHPNQRYRSTGS